MSPEASAAFLSLVVFLPAAGALILLAFGWAFPKDENENWVKTFSTAITAGVFILTLLMYFPVGGMSFQAGVPELQQVFSYDWIPSFNIYYYMGMDGISFPLVLLTSFVSLLAMLASWNIQKSVRGYCILFLLLETGMLGVFLALDFFLFYVFWEVMLLPMYFLIGVWGGPRREYAAIKFFLYTLVGSVLMLVAILMLYFASDLRALNQPEVAARLGGGVRWSELGLTPATVERLQLQGRTQADDDASVVLAGNWAGKNLAGLTLELVEGQQEEGPEVRLATASKRLTVHVGPATTARDVVTAINEDPHARELVTARLASGSSGQGSVIAGQTASLAAPEDEGPLHTFSLVALAKLGQATDQFDYEILGWPMQWWAFWLLFIGFVIKVPSVPVHTWLPDAHVEAPTPISMILAGVLLKMGGYGIIRICYPICPDAGYEFRYVICAIGVISMIYGAFAAMAQKDFKRLVAYSSVSHMGYVVLGLGVWSAVAGSPQPYNSDYWALGITGAMFQMIAHGVSSAGMFFMVGVVYDRVHHRNLNEFGGLFGKMPTYTALAIILFFAGLGLPGLCGFIGEVFVVLSVWNFSKWLAVLSATVVVLTAGYILWTIQRVYLGPEYKGPHPEALTPITPREIGIAVPLCVMAVVLGLFPQQTILRYMVPTVEATAGSLAQWTKTVKDQAGEGEDLPGAEEGEESEEPPATETVRQPEAGAKVSQAVAPQPALRSNHRPPDVDG